MPQRPHVIQGGMGVAVSSWPLASAVSRCGQLGVVSGTALDVVLARRLQDGDPGGHSRRALAAFPLPDVAERALTRYFRPAGRPAGTAYRPVAKHALERAGAARELTVLANFVEVFLAKEGHDGLVGVNYLEKVQLATPFALYGAMLASVDYVLVGAGVPREIAALLDDFAAGRPGHLGVDVAGGERRTLTLDPADWATGGESLRRPQFLAIVSADALATYLAKDDRTRPDGFVVEGPSAGGHNAPPRGRLTLDDDGQPVYGDRDRVDLGRMASVGLPFWLAGSYGTPERLTAALAAGAAGIQVGTVFALSRESGLTPDLRQDALTALAEGRLDVRTSPDASPTGFPFKVATVRGTPQDQTRERLCDVGVLRVPYQRDDGRVGYRCPGEPVDDFVRKGGDRERTDGVECLCNALTANVGLGQTRRDGYVEPPLLTLGAALDGPAQLLELHPDGWSAAEAVAWLTGSPGTAG